MVLALEQVRFMATREAWEELYLNHQSQVVSFVRDDFRINVYWTTGTVCTCFHDMLLGERQVFGRILVPALLQEIFRDPTKNKKSLDRIGTSISPGKRVHVRGYANAIVLPSFEPKKYPGKVRIQYETGQTYHVAPDTLLAADSVDDEETEMQKELLALEEAARDLRNLLGQQENDMKEQEDKHEKVKVESSRRKFSLRGGIPDIQKLCS